MYKSDKKVYKLDTKSTVTCHLKPVTCSLTQPLNIPSIWGVWGSSWQTCWWQSSMQCLAQSAYCPPLFCNRWASCSGRMWPIQSGVDARGRQDLLDPPGQGGLWSFVVGLHNPEEYSGCALTEWFCSSEIFRQVVENTNVSVRGICFQRDPRVLIPRTRLFDKIW